MGKPFSYQIILKNDLHILGYSRDGNHFLGMISITVVTQINKSMVYFT